MSAINRRVMESLIKAGAMDSLEGTRAQLLLAARWRDRDRQRARRRIATADRADCSAAACGGASRAAASPRANDWTTEEKLQGEKELLGFYVTGHPLDSYEDKIAELATHDSTKLEGSRKRRRSSALRHDYGRSSETPQSREASPGRRS